jgi:hypothetical protein
MGTGSFPGVNSGRGVTLTHHPLLVPWSRKGGAVLLFPLHAVRPVQNLSACTMVHFTVRPVQSHSACTRVHFTVRPVQSLRAFTRVYFTLRPVQSLSACTTVHFTVRPVQSLSACTRVHFTFTNTDTPHETVVLRMLTFAQLFMKFPACFSNRSLFICLTSGHHCTMPQVISVQ